MPEYKDAVKDQTTTTGTGTLTIAGVAPAGARTIASAHTNGATVRYRINTSDQSAWEVGQGVWNSSTTTLTRDVVYASSNAGSLVSFAAGTKAVITGLTAADMNITPTALVLLATLTPTAAANVDALSVFTSAYDNYLIIGEGLQCGVSQDIPQFRLAVAGAADTGSNYYNIRISIGSYNTTTAQTLGEVSGGVYMSDWAGSNAARVLNFKLEVLNVNSSTQNKTVLTSCSGVGNSTPTFEARMGVTHYVNTAVVTGIRFFWNTQNFVAGGKIRIYGYN